MIHREYSPEYLAVLRSGRWKRLRVLCFALTWGRCAVYPLLQASDLDHLHYFALGRELPWFDVIPLSRFVHRGLVTPGRRIFGYAFINAILRIAFALWLLLDGSLIYFVLHWLRFL